MGHVTYYRVRLGISNQHDQASRILQRQEMSDTGYNGIDSCGLPEICDPVTTDTSQFVVRPLIPKLTIAVKADSIRLTMGLEMGQASWESGQVSWVREISIRMVSIRLAHSSN